MFAVKIVYNNRESIVGPFASEEDANTYVKGLIAKVEKKFPNYHYILRHYLNGGYYWDADFYSEDLNVPQDITVKDLVEPHVNLFE